jgi:hypothetical protein
MKHILILLTAIFIIGGCVALGQKTVNLDETEYYAQYSFFYKAGMHSSANFREGNLIPINTRIKIRSTGGHSITGGEAFEIVTSDGRHKIVVSHDPEKSGMTLDEYKNRLLSTNRVDLSGYNEQVQDFIRNGEGAIGMSKDMLVKAIGYPPADLTPDMNAESWIYRLNLLQKTYVTFDRFDNVQDIFHK